MNEQIDNLNQESEVDEASEWAAAYAEYVSDYNS